MGSSPRVYSWYCSMVAALCMVLYGYDASVFNSVQGSENWLSYVDLDPDVNTQMLGLSTAHCLPNFSSFRR